MIVWCTGWSEFSMVAHVSSIFIKLYILSATQPTYSEKILSTALHVNVVAFVLVFDVFCHFPKCFLVHIRIKGEVGAVKLV